MMRSTVLAALLGLSVVTPAAAQGGPDVRQLLQGLTTGNQGQDQALQDAFERGYQRGRQDEARQQVSGRGRGNTGRSGRPDMDERNGGETGDNQQNYRNDRDPDQPRGQQNNTYNR
jgi:hypothetical protein